MGRWRAGWAVVSAATVAVVVVCIAGVDRPASTWVHGAVADKTVFVALTHIVDPLLPLAAIGFLAFGGSVLFGATLSRAARLLLTVSVATLLAVMIKDQLKYAFGRTWPETWVNGNPSWIGDHVATFAFFHGGLGWSSFPSGHMALVTAPATALMLVATPLWRAALALPVVLVAIGLFGADYHFVSDILAGTLTGALCAAITVAMLPPGLPVQPGS